MIDILEELYNGNIQEVFRQPSKKYIQFNNEEKIAYDNLTKSFNQKQNELLEIFIEKKQNTEELLVKNAYKQGFKTGLLIGIECNNIKL